MYHLINYKSHYCHSHVHTPFNNLYSFHNGLLCKNPGKVCLLALTKLIYEAVDIHIVNNIYVTNVTTIAYTTLALRSTRSFLQQRVPYDVTSGPLIR